MNPQALSLLYNFHLEGVSRFEGIAFYDDSLAAPSSGWPWAGAVRIYRSGDPTGDFSTPCLGALRGDPAGEKCKSSRYCWHLGCILPRVPAIPVRTGWDGAGQVLGRREQVCGESCDTFAPLIGAANVTSASGIEFPFGPRLKLDDETWERGASSISHERLKAVGGAALVHVDAWKMGSADG